MQYCQQIHNFPRYFVNKVKMIINCHLFFVILREALEINIFMLRLRIITGLQTNAGI